MKRDTQLSKVNKKNNQSVIDGFFFFEATITYLYLILNVNLTVKWIKLHKNNLSSRRHY